MEFRNLNFSYEGAGRLRSKICLRRAGPDSGVARAYSDGKTTIARLLARFYDPQEGSIELAGTDIRDCKLHELRRKVAMVTQNIEILEGTVRDNLTLFDEGIEDRRIISVLEELGLGDWYASLPEGLDTSLASGGGSLSAGEAQRWRLPASF